MAAPIPRVNPTRVMTSLEFLVHIGVVGVHEVLALQDLGKQQPLQGSIVQILRQRPAQALLDRPLHVLAHRAFGQAARRRDPLMTQSHLELEAQNFLDLAHGTPLGWHRHSRGKSSSLASDVGSSADPADPFRGNLTALSGIVTGDSGP